MSAKKFPISLTLAQTRHSHGETTMQLDIRDEGNRSARLIVDLTMEEFGRLLSGEYRLRAEAESFCADEFGWSSAIIPGRKVEPA